MSGAALGASGNIFKGNGGKGPYVEKPTLIKRVIPFEEWNKNDYKQQVLQHSRFKVGDLEIDDPNLNYRQGRGLIKDFHETGKVRI